MDFKSLISKMDDLQEGRAKTPGSFEKLEKSVADRMASDMIKPAAKSKSKDKSSKDPSFDTSKLADVLGGKLPKQKPGILSRVHKTPDFDTDDDDGSEIVREQDVTEPSTDQYEVTQKIIDQILDSLENILFGNKQAELAQLYNSVKHHRSKNKLSENWDNREFLQDNLDELIDAIQKASKENNKKRLFYLYSNTRHLHSKIQRGLELKEDVAKSTQQPRNLKEWMNRVEGISEEVVKAPVSVIQGGKAAQATITSTSTDPTETNVLQAAAEILKKGKGQIQMSPTTTTQPAQPAQSAQQKSGQSVQSTSAQTTMTEEEIDEVAAPGQEDWIKANKQRFIDQYGKEKGLGVLYATAWKRSKGQKESMNENKTSKPIMEGYTLEDIIQRFPHEHKMCQEGWGLDESLYEALADHYHREGRIPFKVWHGPLEELRDHVTKCYAEDTGMLMDESVETASPGDSHFGPLEEVAPLAAIGGAVGGALARGAAGALGVTSNLATNALGAAGRVGGAMAGNALTDMISDRQDESLYELEDLDDLSSEEGTDDVEDFPFPDDMEDEDSMSIDDMNDMKQDDLLDEEDYMMEGKKLNKKLSEETKETKTGRVHKAQPGGYGRKDDENDDDKKVKKDKDAPKRGRGRPKKDADSETGEVKKWDTDTLARWIVGSKPEKLPGKASVKHKIKDESKKMDAQMESWDRELKSLLNEGMTITTSTGQPGGMDSVSVSATDSDAQTLMRMLQDAGIGLGGKSSAMSHGDSEGQSISVEPVAHDEVMGQLTPQDDGGDDALGFIKRMLGARGSESMDSMEMDYESEADHDHAGHDHDESCEECGHSPCDCDDEEVKEGNKFTGELAKARADGVQPGEKMKVDGKEYPVKHGKKMDEEDEHYSDEDDDEDEDDEDDEDHESKDHDDEEDKEKVDEGQQSCNECGGAMYEGHQCETEELNEWANSPMGKSADEDFKTEIEYMTRLISGGLNGQKRDQTTLPHTKVKTEIVKEDISSTIKKLAGIK